MTTPIVSVVVSAHQAAAYLQRSLASVQDQSFGNFEILIVDDGSTDGSAEILDQLAAHDGRVRVLRQANQGLTAALIRACAEARGEFIARHDSDDLSLQGRLARQVECLRHDERLSFVSCWSRALGPRDEFLYEMRRPADPSDATRVLLDGRAPPGHGSVMFRATAYHQVGGYRAAFRYAQDHDLWLRLAEIGQLGYAPEFLYAFRVSEVSISAERRSQQLRLAALARRCAVARQAGEPETPWLEAAVRISAEAPPRRGARDPGNSYFIGKCLLDRHDARCLGYLQRAVRERPANWRACIALLLAHTLRLTRLLKRETRA